MFYQERKKLRKIISIGLVVSVFIFLSACASNKASKQEAGQGVTQSVETGNKLITDITIEDGKDPVTVSIKGNQLLTYTAVKQPQPLGLVMYFPETSLGIAKREYQSEGDIVASIKAVELIEKGPSKVTIFLKSDTPYKIDRTGNGLTISFGQNGQAQQSETTAQAGSGDIQQPAKEAGFVEEKAAVSEAGKSEKNIADSASEPIVEEIPVATVPVSETAAVPGAAVAATPESPVAVDSGVNIFREISAVNADDGVSVLIRSDKAINNYKAFTLENPPRIVLDLNNIKSEFKKPQTISVDSKWVKKIRHFAYPERLRVVLDTEKDYLSSYTVEPSENGLLVMIADSIEPEKIVASQMKSAGLENQKAKSEPIVVEEKQSQEKASPETLAAKTPEVPVAKPLSTPGSSVVEVKPPVIEHKPIAPQAESFSGKSKSMSAKAALVNRIDFLSGDEGKSSIIVGTTRPVNYHLDKTDGMKLSLDLFDTKILSYRQRPLITTRFESAVNRIVPIQTAEMKNNSKVVVELREAVPFTVEQKENEIEILFQASNIKPKPSETAGLTPLEKVMEEAAQEAEAVIEKSEQPDSAVIIPAETVSSSSEEVAVKEDNAVSGTKETAEGSVVKAIEPVPAAPIEVASEDTTGAIAEDSVKVDEQTLPELAEEETEPVAEKKTSKKRYTGEKIALDFYQTDIKNVLRILRDVSGKNFAIDKDVSGSVTLTLVKPIPWDQVLDLILKMNQLGQISEGDIVRIVTISTLRKEEKIRTDELKAAQSIQEQQKELEPLVTEYIPINYADANADINPRLDQIKTAKRGQVGVDARNNQIIITDTAEKIAQAKEIIKSIDKVTPQVVIEARIVEVSENFSRDIGTQWGLTDGPVINGSDSHTYTLAMNHPPSASSGSIGYQFTRIAGTNFSLNAELQAIETAGDGKIISTPKIVTLDNKQAAISQGIEYPYLERDSAGLSTTKFKKIDLELKVKPHVTPDNRINMVINIVKNDIDSITGGVPSLSTNEAKTELLVNDGDTIVIGGILKTNEAQGETRFPLLSSIPIVGWLFKSKNNSTQKNELLIFITPKIVHLESKI